MNVVLYARVSSDKQDVDLSISAQLRALREYAARNNHTMIREFVDEVETGKLDLDDLVVRIRELRKRQEHLQVRRIEIENQMADRKAELLDLETMTEYVTEMQELIRESSLSERRAFIRSFVKEIKVVGNQAILNYSLPVPPEKVAVGGDSVPRIVQYGGRYWI